MDKQNITTITNPIQNQKNQILDYILELEGGYVNHPSDPGGETNFGISKRSYPNLDIKNLSKQKARVIYMQDFWNPNQDILNTLLLADSQTMICNYLNPPTTALFFAFIVNAGQKNAIKILQTTLNSTLPLRSIQLSVDGKFGTLSQQALMQTIFTKSPSDPSDYNTSLPSLPKYIAFYANLKFFIAKYYCSLCINKKSQLVFLNGWLNRIQHKI